MTDGSNGRHTGSEISPDESASQIIPVDASEEEEERGSITDLPTDEEEVEESGEEEEESGSITDRPTDEEEVEESGEEEEREGSDAEEIELERVDVEESELLEEKSEDSDELEESDELADGEEESELEETELEESELPEDELGEEIQEDLMYEDLEEEEVSPEDKVAEYLARQAELALRKEAIAEVKAKGDWHPDEVFLFERLSMRSFEEVFPADWKREFPTLSADLFTADEKNAFINFNCGSTQLGECRITILAFQD